MSKKNGGGGVGKKEKKHTGLIAKTEDVLHVVSGADRFEGFFLNGKHRSHGLCRRVGG